MEKITYKLMDNKINQDELIEIFKKEINKNPKFYSNVTDDLISVEFGYLAYDFYYGRINDLEYLVVQNNKEISSKINVEVDMPSALFLLNGLSRNDEANIVEDINSYIIFNYNDLEKNKELFLNKINIKSEEMIAKRHNVFLRKKNQKIDIAPIRKFDEFIQEIYLEPVYRIHARSKQKKKALVSVYSGFNKTFYKLDYLYSEEYDAFLKRFKNPVVYIPKYLIDDYYNMAFDVYLKTIKELRYINELQLLKKIKLNIGYHEYTKYHDYLFQGIFYFKKRGYLANYFVDLENESVRKRLLDLYLTLSFQPKSGLILSEYNQLGLCEYNDIKEWLGFLKKSYQLGCLEAKKKLFDYYLKPNCYDDYYLKRYS